MPPVREKEEDLIQLVCDNFDHVVVVLNANNPMELGWVDEYEQIGAVIWAPGPGATGFAALGQILSGAVNPSGRTAEIFLTDLFAATSPYINNFGNFRYTNVDDVASTIFAADPAANGTVSFVNYVEGIYVGYKYWETAYVVSNHSATMTRALRQASKNILFTIVNSGYYTKADSDPANQPDKMVSMFRTADVITVVILAACEALLIWNWRKKKAR